jgi:hypothetical protein
MSAFIVIVVLVLLVIGDFVAKAVATNDITSQIQSQAKLANSPQVSIQGFPFLTQVISKDLQEIDIKLSNVPAGPVTITTITAVAKGVHINSSWNGGLVDSVNGTAFISFGALGQALSSTGVSQIVNISLAQAGPNKIKATASFAGLASITEVATVKQVGNKITIMFDQNGSSGGSAIGDIGGVIGNVIGGSSGSGSGGPTIPDLSFTLPSNIPAGLKLASVSVTATGVVATVSAQHAKLTQ